ncbi:MAG TPA: phosphatase PAP2 family protein [Burkholderiales bacterium]|nr:phosphatase PAP2 family protein [Burkholderiales bacterium]
MIRVPLITAANQARALLLGYLAFSLVYLGSGGLHVGAPLAVPASGLDAAIPYVPATIWIYLTQFLLLPGSIVLARDDDDRSRAFYAMLVATALAAAVFVLWPTQLERQSPPAQGLMGFAWSALYFSDTPNNCLPSLHVALAALAGCVLWRSGWRLTAVLWPSLIALSTLTTKQHVLIDVAGGLALAAVAWVLVPKLVCHERPQPAHNPGCA